MRRRWLDSTAGPGPAALFLVLGAAAVLAGAVYALLDAPPLWALRAGALAAGLGLAVANFRWAVLAVVILSPLLGIVPRGLGAPDLSLVEHLMLPVLLWGGLLALRSPARRRRAAVDFALAVWLAVVLISALTALGEYVAVVSAPGAMFGDAVRRHFSFSIMDYARGPFLVVHGAVVLLEGGLWFLLLTSPVARVNAIDLRRALLASSVCVIAVGLLQTVWPVGLPEYFRRAQPMLLRINSTLPDPNTLGAYLVLIFPIGLAAALESRRGAPWVFAWSAAVGTCLVAAVSRTAWVGLAGASLVAAWAVGRDPASFGISLAPRRARWLRRAPAVAALAAVAIASAVTTGDLARTVSYAGARSRLDIVLYSLDWNRPLGELVPSRPVHWSAAIQIWRDFPLFGAGVGKYPLLKNRYLPEARTRWMFFTEPHCYYLKVLSELGIAGLAAFGAVLATIFVQASRARAAATDSGRRRIVGATFGLAAFLLCSLGQDPLALREIQYLFWTVVALIVLDPPAEVELGARSGAENSRVERGLTSGIAIAHSTPVGGSK